MRKSLFSRAAKGVLHHLQRRGQSGQALIITALGFVALLGFVGLVTDFSLLFVRFSTLQRAVDAAAISAAGQMRSDRNYANVNLAARQFIEFHGLSPLEVRVDTCESLLGNRTEADFQAQAAGDPAIDADFKVYKQLRCGVKKMVRVGATIESPLVFLPLVGVQSPIQLNAVAFSETAVLDLVMVLDVSESMVEDTRIGDYAYKDLDLAKVYVPPDWQSAAAGDMYGMQEYGIQPNTPAQPHVDSGVGGAFTNRDGINPELWNSGNDRLTTIPADRSTTVKRTGDPNRNYIDAVQVWKYWLGGKPDISQGVVDPYYPMNQEDVSRMVYYPDGNHNQSEYGNFREGRVAYEARSFDLPDSFRTRDPQGVGVQQRPPRRECRVRFWPYSTAIAVQDSIQEVYQAKFDDPTSDQAMRTALGRYLDSPSSNNPAWQGFVPTYDFYDCCNDPTSGGAFENKGIGETAGTPNNAIFDNSAINYTTDEWTDPDRDFSDLVCQPFKQARDATRDFLEQVDFGRGDRVSFVTFDRTAFLVDPDGAEGEAYEPDVLNALLADPGNTEARCREEFKEEQDENGATIYRSGLTHMIECYDRAVDTLNQHIGVRADPYFYDWNQEGGGWTGFAWVDTRGNRGGFAADEDGYNAACATKGVDYYKPAREFNPDGSIEYNVDDPATPLYDADPNYPCPEDRNYPVASNCPMHDAQLGQFYSLYSPWSWRFADTSTNATYNPQITNTGTGALERLMLPNPHEPPWEQYDLDARSSYELWASCRGTNVGAALRAANSALLDPTTTRREGTVWVLVFLGDGAAGASDPVRRNGAVVPQARPYLDREAAGYNRAEWFTYETDTPAQSLGNILKYGSGPEITGAYETYGAYGLCPIGSPDTAGTLSRLTRVLGTDSPLFPFCSDIQPHTRHFCVPLNELIESVGYRCEGDPSQLVPNNGLLSGQGAGFAPGAYDETYECAPVDENGDAIPPENVSAYNLQRGNIYDVDIGNFPNDTACDQMYDVDDYARDWADFVGLTLTGSADEQLPTIFSIGFGIDFVEDSPTPELPPSDPDYKPGPPYTPNGDPVNVPDYMGEELFRYLADVGDNFRIDTDYQQGTFEPFTGIPRKDLPADQWGVRGPCENPVGYVDPYFYSNNAGDPTPNDGSFAGTVVPGSVSPLEPRTNCGNYYNAPGGAQLQLVFDDIASRMFTRLSQ